MHYMSHSGTSPPAACLAVLTVVPYCLLPTFINVAVNVVALLYPEWCEQIADAIY